jgi:hypothetical protein
VPANSINSRRIMSRRNNREPDPSHWAPRGGRLAGV